MQTWVNGSEIAHISVKDRALQYGDGFFTTALCTINPEGKMTLEQGYFHYERLYFAAKRLAFNEGDVTLLINDCHTQLKTHAPGDYLIKLTLTRGEGARGYAPSKTNANRIVQITSHSKKAATYDALVLKTAPQRIGISPIHGGIKTLNRLEQVMLADALSSEPDIDDYLVLNHEGNVIETTKANLIFLKNGQLYTPSTCLSGVTGTFLKALQVTLPIKTCEIKPSWLDDIDAAWCCNSVMGLRPIKHINHLKLRVTDIYASKRI